MQKQKNIIIAAIHSWNIDNARQLKRRLKNVHIVSKKEELTAEYVKRINPAYIFFPHWSWYIPDNIYQNYNCVIFHMTDLPYGRGGSPLQNLIVRGHKSTKISALKAAAKMDAGAVFLKMPLSLQGTAQVIYQRASGIIFSKMIPRILKGAFSLKAQKGKVVEFTRRKPEDGDLSKLKALSKIFDYIRMLDAPGYPRAFVRSGKLLVKFSKVRTEKGKTIAEAEIEIEK